MFTEDKFLKLCVMEGARKGDRVAGGREAPFMEMRKIKGEQPC